MPMPSLPPPAPAPESAEPPADSGPPLSEAEHQPAIGERPIDHYPVPFAPLPPVADRPEPPLAPPPPEQ